MGLGQSQGLQQFNGASSSSLLLLLAIHTETLPYLSRLLIPYRLSRVLRSSSSNNLLQVPHSH